MKYYFTIILTLLLLVPAVKAADYYVSVDGDNNNPGTLAEPFRTIQMGADMAAPGDNIYILGGTYEENVILENGGTSYDQMVSLMPYNEDEVIIDVPADYGILVKETADYVRIEGLTVTGATPVTVPYGNAMVLQGDYGIYRYNTIRDNNKNGIYVVGSYADSISQIIIANVHNEVSYNILYNNGASGIRVKHSDHIKVHHNTFYNNNINPEHTKKGALTWYCGENGEYYQNTFWGNAGFGIHLYNGSNPCPTPGSKAWGNLVVATDPLNVVFAVDEMSINLPSNEYNYNLWHTHGISDIRFGWGFNQNLRGGRVLDYNRYVDVAGMVNPLNGFGDIVAAPLLAEPENNNFMLEWDSPAIDAGPDDQQYYDPDGTRPDLGAYYFDQSGSGEIAVTLTPSTLNTQIPSEGGMVDFMLTLENTSSVARTFIYWIEATLPVGGHFGPLGDVSSMELAPGEVFEAELEIYVPAGASEGSYMINAYAGMNDPVSFYGSDRFGFDKIGMDASSRRNWRVTVKGEQYSNKEIVESSKKFTTGLTIGPNPFNPTTTITFDLPEATEVNLVVYNVSGREVANLIDGYQTAGYHEFTFDAKELVSGVYFVRLTVNSGQSMVQKVVLMK
jgi:parallel beta-helix repeat protein